MKQFLFALGFLLIASSVAADDQYIVFAGAVCPIEASQADAERMKKSVIAPDPRCRRFPGAVPIVKVHSGPFRDWEGDQFFIVQVDDAGLWFTFAWPGFNSNLPKTAGA